MTVTTLLVEFATAALGFLAARLASATFGLDDLADDLGRWLRTTFPLPTYTGGVAA